MGGMDMPPMTIHKWLGTALAVVFLALTFWRWRIHRRAEELPSRLYLTCAAVIVGLLTLQGHLGGKMSFSATTDESAASPTTHPHNAGETAGHHDHPIEWRDHIDVKD